MKERPIIFSDKMAQGIGDGRKTQTRRVVKPQPVLRDGDDSCWSWRYGEKNPPQLSRWFDVESFGDTLSRYCPYGQPGDRLWVRETWVEIEHGRNAAYRADTKEPFLSQIKWSPSIFMPRWASRITLEVVSVRVERLQGISESDAIAEGVGVYGGYAGLAAIGAGLLAANPKLLRRGFLKGFMAAGLWTVNHKFADVPTSQRGAFAALWDTTNASRGYVWNLNPWVWVIGFKLAAKGEVK